MTQLKTWSMFAVLMALLLAGMPAVAGEVSVQARVDRIQVADGEPIRLSITVNGGEGAVDLSPLTDFEVQSRGSSTNIQIVNGRFAKEIRYDYGLVPKKTGRLTIPALSVKTDEGMLRTAPIDIRVADAPQPGDGQTPDIFVEAEVSKNTLFAGEQLVYRFRFFNAVRIADNARFQPPDFAGFTARKVEKEKVFQRTVNGRTYQVTEISFVLIPLEAGGKVLGPAVIQCQMFRKGERRDPMARLSPFFDDRFFSRFRAEPRTLRTKAIPITVRPLPPVPLNMTFSGLVGRFDMDAQVDEKRVSVGDSVTVTVSVTGQGNVMDAPAPNLPALSEAKVYADTPEDETAVTDQGITGTKRFRFALVPSRPGALVLPEMTLGVFDPSREAYRRIATSPISIGVDPATESETPPAVQSEPGLPPVRKKPVTFSGRDILPPKESLDAVEDRPALSLPMFMAGMASPAAVYLIFVLLLAVWKRPETAGRKMAKRAREQIQLAEAARNGSDADFLGALYAALVTAVLGAAGRQGGALTVAEAKPLLSETGIHEKDIQSVADLLERIEAARFGGARLDPDSRADLMRETRKRVRGLRP